MKHYPPPTPQTRRPSPPRIPQFYAVPARSRRDGWTPRRQAEFIGHLAETRSVTEAARRVGMTRETAYRLRRRAWAESFAAAWDAAMRRPARRSEARPSGENERSHRAFSLPRKVTTDELAWRVETGLWQVRMFNGKFVNLAQKADNNALLRLVSRLDPLRPSHRYGSSGQ